MRRLLEELREHADFVLLDTPPLLAVADATIVAPSSDGVIIVADAGRTTKAAVSHVREQLDQVGANVVGGVYNNFDPSDAKYYPKYYRYYYTYEYQTPPEKNRGQTAGGN